MREMVVSTRRVRVLLVAMAVVGMALGVIGVLGAVSSASPNNTDDDHRNDKGRTLTLVVKNSERSVVDLGAQGPTQGDMRVINAPLYDASGKERIGRFDTFCVQTDPAEQSGEKHHIFQCTITFTLPGGTVAAQGSNAYPKLTGPPPRGVHAITGGTGKYAGVGGEQRFETRGNKVINTLRFSD